MILTESTTIDASDVEKAFTNAQSLRDPKWLSLQHRLTPNDPLLAHLIPASTKPQAIHGIRQGFPKRMHPVAEAVLVGKMIIDEFRSDGHLRVSRFIPLLFSLSHVAKAAPSIPNIQSRLAKLTGKEWKSSLYELLIAASYVPLSDPEFLPETGFHTPDLKLKRTPPVYVECKSRLSHEQEVDMLIVER